MGRDGQRWDEMGKAKAKQETHQWQTTLAHARDRRGEGVPLPADVMALDNITGVSIERRAGGHDDDELTHDLAMCHELEPKVDLEAESGTSNGNTSTYTMVSVT